MILRCTISRVAAFLALALVTAVPALVNAQERPAEGAGGTTSDPPRINAVLVPEGPRIDGNLDDPVWQSASVVDAFIQQEPDEGAPATERTEVRVLYDGSSLYIGVHAYDDTPGGPIATELRRDANRILDEDNFQVILDTFRDYRSAYMFVVSPLGAQLDQQVFDDGGRDRRASARAVNRDWDGVWAASARRTSDGWVAEMAIPMVNMRFPANEPQSWGINFKRVIRTKNEEVFWAPVPRAFDVTRVSLAGSLEGLHSLDRGLDLRVKPYATGGGRWQRNGGVSDNSHTEDVGVDVKYGVIPGLNLDLTYNTDFAQAEVDNEQVNLTRFALFYPEKREFFLENAAQFSVGTSNSTGRIADLFFSRRIGITSSRATVPIFGGARLTGKLGSNNIAIMDIQTETLEAGDGSTIEPGQNFLVARYSRDVLGASQVGGLVINKQASSGGSYNRTFAVDALFSVIPEFTVEGFVAKTETPDLDGRDWAGHIRSGWLSQHWRVYGEYTDLDNNFNPEVGFVPRVGIRRTKAHFEYNPRPGRWGIRMMEPMWNVTLFHDHSGRLVSRQFHHMVGTRFDNGAYFNVMYNRYYELLDNPYRVTSDITVDPGEYNFWDLIVMFRSNPARRLSFNVRYAPQTYWDGDRTDWGGGVDVRVTNQLAASGNFSRNTVDLPGGDFTADIASFQLDYGFSPRLSVRTLTQYNSLTDQVSVSGRLQYEYRPGSDIFIVYDEVRRDDPIPVSPFTERFRDRQLLLKVTYLFTM
ncbi:MAG: DUF5916 domain-containing protein [Gemmatimonadota bacterium]|jgi:hypothetical protein